MLNEIRLLVFKKENVGMILFFFAFFPWSIRFSLHALRRFYSSFTIPCIFRLSRFFTPKPRKEYKWQCLNYGRLHIFQFTKLIMQPTEKRKMDEWKNFLDIFTLRFSELHSVNWVLGILWAKIFIAMIGVWGLRFEESNKWKKIQNQKERQNRQT